VPFYYTIDNATDAGRRTATRLLALRDQLDREVPQRTLVDTLLLATWNIREFDSKKYGRRADEALFYIAEIISRFDLVAVQEVNENMEALVRLQRILGGWWNYLVTDVTEGTQGNRERLAFLYDGRKVRMTGLAGEIVLPSKKTKETGFEPVVQFARTPFIAGFGAGWFKFMLATVHIIYGAAQAADPRRVAEINELAAFFQKRAAKELEKENNLILLGDFNIFNVEDATFQALTDHGFIIPTQIQKLPSNVEGSKHYDQIAFLPRREMNLAKIKAGAFNFYKTVYRDEDANDYKSEMGKGDYKAWRTFQMSDHFPLWVELRIDFGLEYLQSKTKAATDSKQKTSRKSPIK